MAAPDTPPPVNAFTFEYNGRSNELASNVRIHPLFDPNAPPVSEFDYKAIWDTGATNSVISHKVVADLGLEPIGETRVSGVHGVQLCNTYLVCFSLPNRVCFDKILVTDGDLGTYDALIGMDIIGAGDFAVSFHDNKTTFTYRYPSGGRVDFVKELESGKKPFARQEPKPGRNDDCPCGSGKKFKKCHGNKLG